MHATCAMRLRNANGAQRSESEFSTSPTVSCVVLRVRVCFVYERCSTCMHVYVCIYPCTLSQLPRCPVVFVVVVFSLVYCICVSAIRFGVLLWAWLVLTFAAARNSLVVSCAWPGLAPSPSRVFAFRVACVSIIYRCVCVCVYTVLLDPLCL